MALTLTVIGKIKLINGFEFIVEHDFSGSYATPGELPAYKTALNPLGSKEPVSVVFSETAGYTYKYVKSTGRLKVHIYDYNNAADGPTIEIPDAAYPAGVTGDTEIIARVTFVN